MIEYFLHYIWLYKKIDVLHLQTTQLEPLEVISVGFPNPNSGPDFFNGQLRIGEQLWVGNIEIHIKSSDWYIHNHHNDKAYDNVILHVVYDHDIDIYRKDNTVIPTLELQPFIDDDLLRSYDKLLSRGQRWINCEYGIDSIPGVKWNKWIERLYFERLKEKANRIEELYVKTKSNWEEVLFLMLLRGFGSTVNGDAFLSVGRSLNFAIIQKVRSEILCLEALLYGQAGLLNVDCSDDYYCKLKDTHNYLKQKFQIDSSNIQAVKFFRLRPLNFPTIRLSQLASLYTRHPKLFSRIIEADRMSDYYDLFEISASEYWETHYTFGKLSKMKRKTLNKKFIDILILNTLLPLKFFYAKQKGLDISEHITNLMCSIPSENNSIIKNFRMLNIESTNALTSQALIQLKTVYCDYNKCLKCTVGHSLLSK